MDDLTHLHARLKELVDGKIERIAALKAEIVAIEAELDEAKAILGAWGTPVAPPAPVILAAPIAEAVVESDDERRRLEHKAKRVAHVIKMRLPDVLVFLQAMGPQEPRRILEHFGITGRGAGIFGVWANQGTLVKHADGRYAAPSSVPAPAIETLSSFQSQGSSSIEPLQRVAHPRFG